MTATITSADPATEVQSPEPANAVRSPEVLRMKDAVAQLKDKVMAVSHQHDLLGSAANDMRELLLHMEDRLDQGEAPTLGFSKIEDKVDVVANIRDLLAGTVNDMDAAIRDAGDCRDASRTTGEITPAAAGKVLSEPMTAHEEEPASARSPAESPGLAPENGAPTAPLVLRHQPKRHSIMTDVCFTRQFHPYFRDRLISLLRDDEVAFWNSLSDVLTDYGQYFPDDDDDHVDTVAYLLATIADALHDASETPGLFGAWASDLAQYASRYKRPEGWTEPAIPKLWHDPDNVIITLEEAAQLVLESNGHDQVRKFAAILKTSEEDAAVFYVRVSLRMLRERAASGAHASPAAEPKPAHESESVA